MASTRLITMPIQVAVNGSDNQWEGFVEGIGVTVYGDSEDAIQNRTEELISFIVSTYQKYYTFDDFCAYLDKHHINYSTDQAQPSAVVFYPCGRGYSPNVLTKAAVAAFA